MPFVPQKHTPTLIGMFLRCGIWSIDNLYGKIENVTFKDISVFSDDSDFNSTVSLRGYNEEHCIKGVTFQNITHNGKVLSTPEALHISANEFADFIYEGNGNRSSN